MGIVLAKRGRGQINNVTVKKYAKSSNIFIFWLIKLVFRDFALNICQFLRSLKNSALGDRLSRHGLATALLSYFLTCSSQKIAKKCHMLFEWSQTHTGAFCSIWRTTHLWYTYQRLKIGALDLLSSLRNLSVCTFFHCYLFCHVTKFTKVFKF
jgi:hypothetical protein